MCSNKSTEDKVKEEIMQRLYLTDAEYEKNREKIENTYMYQSTMLRVTFKDFLKLLYTETMKLFIR